MSLFGKKEVSDYDYQQFNDLRDEINNTAQQTGQKIVEALYNSIVIPISNVWHSPEAVAFFVDFAETVKTSEENITVAFDTLKCVIESIGTKRSKNTGGKLPVLPVIDNVKLDLDISNIQSSSGVIVTIDIGQVTKIANNLTGIKEELSSVLKDLFENLDLKSSFVGPEREIALQQCFVTVDKEICKIFNYLIYGDKSLQKQINNVTQKESHF